MKSFEKTKKNEKKKDQFIAIIICVKMRIKGTLPIETVMGKNDNGIDIDSSCYV